jgi:single-strand DNA-binding protein
MINQCNFIGRLGADVEQRYTQSGKAVASFSIAVQERKDSPTEWVRIVAWERLAEVCTEFLTKGSLVFVSGRLQTRSWEQDGQKKYTTEIVAREMKMLDTRREEQHGQEESTGDLPF